jgi:hypothetical protein
VPFLHLTKDDTHKPTLVNMEHVIEVLQHGPGGSVLSLTNGATLTVTESLDDIARLLASPPPPPPFRPREPGTESTRPPAVDIDGEDDSPKRQGDKKARDAAAGRKKKKARA